ncbi:MAG: hypothetical protein LC624_09880 [Halobacteriales archaeon]|nr:hypothetical protein [Halobacteriales archaeon]
MRHAAVLLCLLLLAPFAHAPGSVVPERASHLLSLAGAPHGDALRDAVRLAEAAAPGRALPTAHHASPSAAAEALLASRGVAGDVRALDALPPRSAQALTQLLDAFLAFDAAAPQLAGVLGPRAALLDAMVGFRDALAVEAAPPLRLQVPGAFALDLAGTSDAYIQDFALQIDVGGDDTYRNHAGGSNVGGSDACAIPSTGHGSALLDLAGDDRYVSGRRCGVNGGGWLGGAGLLVDAAGDDVYAAWDNAVNGGAILGTGLLLDAQGDDTYLAGGVGTNGGAAERGLGMLLDLAGNDQYLAGPVGTNGGGDLLGSGLLLDAGGNDAYVATQIGVNGGGWLGGTGMLLDASGDDRYTAGLLAINGGGGTAGIGLLLDGAGHDAYEDLEGGSGADRTVAPKGLVGAQLDLAG